MVIHTLSPCILQQLESYITELIPTLVQLSGMDASFIQFYVCTAVRKFFFFLDPNKTGRCKILDILTSGFIDELLDVRKITSMLYIQSIL